MNGKETVWDHVEAFRRQYMADALDRLPIDVFTLIELRLKLDVIIVDDLFAKYDCDAAIKQDFTGIYVDAEAYLLWEKGPVWKQNRLRLSVAHELGHYVLKEKAMGSPKHMTYGSERLRCQAATQAVKRFGTVLEKGGERRRFVAELKRRMSTIWMPPHCLLL